MRFIRPAIAILVLATGASVLAQRPTDIVKWSATRGAHAVKAGAVVRIELTADVAPGWHLYALIQPKGGPNPLKIAVAAGRPFEVRTRDITAPAAEVTKDDNFGLETRQHDGKVVFTVPVAAATMAPVGAHEVPIEITFQACGNGICLRPFTQTLPLRLIVSK